MSWAVWICGPPVSGKAVARATAELLQVRGEPVRVLELEAIRPRLIPDPRNTESQRDLVHRALGYMAARLTEAGIPVIVAASAPRRRWGELARATIRRFAEVQLEGRPGTTVPPVDVPYEPALASELVIDTTRSDVSLSAAAVASLAEQLASGTKGKREGVMRWAIWITGRPGSGKTTLAHRVAELLATEPVPTTVLDLAFARRSIAGREWATEGQEEIVHRTLALTAKFLTEAGVAVLLDATAPRRAWRELGREWITHFAEVQLICPAEVCAARERAVRWHLGGARLDPTGQATGTPDIALAYEESLYPELRLHTHAPDLTISVEAVLRLAKRLERRATARATDQERSIT